MIGGHERPALSRHAIRGLLLYLAVEVILAAAVINYFCRAFDIDRTLLLVHLPIVLFILGASLLLGVIPAAAAASVLVVLYLADFASNIETGSNITYKLVQIWAADLWAGGNILAISRWVYIGLVAIVVVIFAIHIAYRRTINDGRCALVRYHGKALLAGLVIAAAGYAVYFAYLAKHTSRSELLTSDPVLALLRRQIDVYDDSYRAVADQVRAADADARARYPRGLTFDKKNVIVIIVDSLRADHMGLYGYERPTTPFLSGLYASGKLRKVDHATSTCAESNCGILSTLFSKTLRHQLPEDFKLYDLLKDQGYTSNFVLSGNHDWRDLREMYGHEHTLYFDGRDSKQFKSNDDHVIFEGLERVPPSAAPAFFYFHLMSVHLIGTKFDEFRVYQPSSVKNDWDTLFSGAYDRQTVVNNYDNGVRQADAMIERLFAALDAKGFLKNSLIAILADHGEGLGERSRTGFGHVTSLYSEFINIPMLIYDDSSTRYSNLQVATQIDVAPTILERLGLPIPPTFEGRSMLSGAPRDLSFHQTALKNPCYAMVYRPSGRVYKYLSCFLRHREEVYDLDADPGERENIRDSVDPAVLQFFRDELARFKTK